jgi:hypothetical protein
MINTTRISVSSPYGAVEMIDVDPQYFREYVSTEVKDQAKERGLVHYDKERGKIVLNDDPDMYMKDLEEEGLERFLKKRIKGEL